MKKLSKKVKSNKYVTVGIMAFFAVTGVFYILLSSAATPGTPAFGFYMTTTNAAPPVNTQFDVKLYANAGSAQVKSISALLKYDASAVRADIVASAPKADPLASPPIAGFDETLSCGPANGCRTDTGFVAFALTNTGTTTRSGDGMYLGTVRFTALKSGTTALQYDTSDPKLTAFLDTNNQQITGSTTQNLNVTPPASGGTTTPPASGGGGSSNQTNTTNTSTKSNTGSTTGNTSKTTGNTSTGSSAGTQQTGSSTPGDTTQSTDNQQPTAVPGTTNGSGGSSDTDGSSGDGPKTVSKPMIIVASAGLAALIVGTIMAAFSEPVRNAFMGVGHILHPQHIQPAGHVVVGGPSLPATPPAPHVDPTPTNPVNPIKPISHLDPPKTSNTIPSHAGAPGKVIEPSQPPTEE